ncbi:MAG: IPT/TIG domain-containing protein [Cyclobacteriaceae bacterium]
MRKRHLLIAAPIMAAFLFLQSCTKKEDITVPTITAFTPTSGLPGSSVTITGTNFSSTASKNYVTIDGLQATITDASSTSITATVSANATTGTAGKITVTANGLTAVSDNDFSVTAVPPVTTTVVTGEIKTDTHWTADQHYLLSGFIYVTSGSTLTIDAGTIIKGDKATKGALIVEQGGKLVAIGTPEKPIVFTSNQPKGQRTYGDWGGVILCGKAPVNWINAPKNDGTGGNVASGMGQVEGGPRSLYGGTDAHDNSGTLQYVRIEFGGVAFSQDNEVNGLTLAGVGDGTTMDHIQVSFAGDDSFEWFGGTARMKYIIAHRGLDDDFDTDNGFAGAVQFAVALRDPNVADQSGSKAFESDSYQTGTKTDGTIPTQAVFSNVTVVGGVTSPTSTSYDPQFVSAIQLRKGSRLGIVNSVITAHPTGILLSNEGVTGQSWNALGQSLVDVVHIQNNYFGGIPTNSTRVVYGIAPTNNAATATFDKNVVIVTNNTRSRTPTFEVAGTTNGTGKSSLAPYVDSVTYVSWFQSQTGGSSYSGPYSWLGSNTWYDADVNNRYVYTEQTGIRLLSPFNLTAPNFFPSSTSPVTVNTLSGTGAGITTTGQAPSGTNGSNALAKISPTFTGVFNNSFFDQTVDYIGAFKSGGTDWTLLWTNWDPNNADYGDAY